MTLEECGRFFGLTRERVRQIQEIALERCLGRLPKDASPTGEKIYWFD
jgi:DNA-directed RNA polymerase sigma subunit (sigma70/sigma32)